MSNDIETKLRAALKPVDPPQGFAERVLATIEREKASVVEPLRKRPERSFSWRWFPVALAASAVFGITIVHQANEREERRGIEAREQLLEALRVTSDKLDSAYHAVKTEHSAAADNGPGA